MKEERFLSPTAHVTSVPAAPGSPPELEADWSDHLDFIEVSWR